MHNQLYNHMSNRSSNRSFFGKVFGLGCLLQLGVFVLGFFLVFTVIKSCKNMEKENNTTLMQELGKGAKKISNEFNKGFNADTVKIDTLKTK